MIFFRNMREIAVDGLLRSERAFVVEDALGTEHIVVVRIVRQKNSLHELHFTVTARKVNPDGSTVMDGDEPVQTWDHQIGANKYGLIGAEMTIDSYIADETLRSINRVLAHEQAIRAWRRIPEAEEAEVAEEKE